MHGSNKSLAINRINRMGGKSFVFNSIPIPRAGSYVQNVASLWRIFLFWS
jgi:hypothetical protein